MKEWGQTATIDTLKQRAVDAVNKWNGMIRYESPRASSCIADRHCPTAPMWPRQTRWPLCCAIWTRAPPHSR